MSTKPRLEDVHDTLGVAINNLLTGVVPNRYVIAKGEPAATELVKILGAQQFYVGLCLLGSSKNETRYDPYDQMAFLPPPAVTLTESVSGDVLTFGGTSQAGLNVHVFVGSPIVDVLVQTGANDTPATIAAAVAAAVNARSLAGVSASVSGDAVTVTGSPKLACTIGAQGTYVQELGRETIMLQVSIYAPTSTVRFAVGEAIKAGVGTAKSRHFAMSDGLDMNVRYRGQRLINEAQSSYSCLEWHFSFEVEYPETVNIPTAQVGAAELISIVNTNAPITTYSA